MTNFTIDEVLQFINGELTEDRATAFQLAFENDANLRNTYENLLSTSTLLNKHSVAPDARSIENILRYAQRTPAVDFC
jgi:hypothetical protein